MNQDLNKTKNKRRKRRWLRRIITLLLVVALLGGIGWYGYIMLKQEYTVTYDGYTASIGSISNSLSFSGNLQLINNTTYYASSSSSVRKIYAEVGADVSDGDKLVRLTNGETIEAEFDGRINALSVEEGDDVLSGDALVQVADFSRMKVSFRIDEYDIADVSIGQACTVTATATEKKFDSEIASIDYISASGGNVAYYTAVAYVDVDEGIYPGMQVTLSIPQEEAKDVVILKMDALSFDAMNSAFVYMYNEAGELEQVPVEVGVSNGNYVEIKSGLSDGDEVYVEAQEDESSSPIGGLLSGLFGSQRMNAPGGMGGFGGGMPDFSSMGGMPDFSRMGGGMPSFGGSGGNSGSGSGMSSRGGFGGGSGGNSGGMRGQMGGGR